MKKAKHTGRRSAKRVCLRAQEPQPADPPAAIAAADAAEGGDIFNPNHPDAQPCPADSPPTDEHLLDGRYDWPVVYKELFGCPAKVLFWCDIALVSAFVEAKLKLPETATRMDEWRIEDFVVARWDFLNHNVSPRPAEPHPAPTLMHEQSGWPGFDLRLDLPHGGYPTGLYCAVATALAPLAPRVAADFEARDGPVQGRWTSAALQRVAEEALGMPPGLLHPKRRLIKDVLYKVLPGTSADKFALWKKVATADRELCACPKFPPSFPDSDSDSSCLTSSHG